MPALVHLQPPDQNKENIGSPHTLVKQIKEQLICEAQETTSHFEQNLPRSNFRVKLADEPAEKGRKKETGEAGRADLQQ